MFMDPSAFEAEDIERELREAGFEPDAISTTRDGAASSTFQGSRDGQDDPVRLQGIGAIGAPPSSGSYFGLNSGDGPEGDRKLQKRQLRSKDKGHAHGDIVGLRASEGTTTGGQTGLVAILPLGAWVFFENDEEDLSAPSRLGTGY